jgi:hypothetical protein
MWMTLYHLVCSSPYKEALLFAVDIITVCLEQKASKLLVAVDITGVSSTHCRAVAKTVLHSIQGEFIFS